MREERRKTFYNVGEREKEIAVSRRQRSREKNALESEGREIEREPLHDAQRRQRSKENNDFKRAGREIRLYRRTSIRQQESQESKEARTTIYTVNIPLNMISRVAAGIVSQMVLWVITSNVTVYACN